QGGWNNGFRSCAHWLNWRVGLDLGAARERVRVARALGTLPLLAQALAKGELSYAKVRALTRVATPETEARLLAVGRAGTADHVERIVRGWRRMDRNAEIAEAKQQHVHRALHVYQDEDGMVVVRGRLAPEVGAVLIKALAAAREALYQQARATRAEIGLVVESWRFPPGPARFRRRSGGRSITETAAVASRAAESASGRAITFATGPRVGPPRSRIWPCSVAGTIAPFTRTAISWLDGLTASWSSAVRMGGYCLRSRRILTCPEIPWESCARSMMQKGWSCTRTPPPRGGLGSA